MEKLLTTDEAASLLGLSLSKLYKLTAAQAIPVVKLGRRVLFNPRRLEEWVAEHEQASINPHEEEKGGEHGRR